MTTLYPPAPAAAPSVDDASSRGARLSSRQLDALLNGSESGADAPLEAEPLKPAPAQGEAGIPLAYRVAHRLPAWSAGQTPRLERIRQDGVAPLILDI